MLDYLCKYFKAFLSGIALFVTFKFSHESFLWPLLFISVDTLTLLYVVPKKFEGNELLRHFILILYTVWFVCGAAVAPGILNHVPLTPLSIMVTGWVYAIDAILLFDLTRRLTLVIIASFKDAKAQSTIMK